VHVEYAHESEPLGTAGPLALVRKQFGHSVKENDSLLVMNGDLLTELDMRLVIDFHENAGNDITVVTREFQLKHPYGVIEVDGDHITNVIEKPSVIDTINAGIYVFRWSALELVPDGQTFEMPELLNTALESGRSVRAYPFSGAWLAIDGMEQLEDAARIVAAVRE
jgi:NDP-sugar pyrophosphorylase family protein